MFSNIKVRDIVYRNLAGVLMPLKVTMIDKDFIYCGPVGVGWKFDVNTGAEIDEYLDWGNEHTGSFIEPNE